MATRQGLVKKSRLKEYVSARRSGIIALGLTAGDELIAVRHLSCGEEGDFEKVDVDVLMATAGGLLIRFPAQQLRSLGRTARGVKGITLAPGDRVVNMALLSNDPPEKTALLLVTENGFEKLPGRTP